MHEKQYKICTFCTKNDKIKAEGDIMYRKIEKDLLEWKKNFKMPLMLIGARQTGKTYILDCIVELKDWVELYAGKEVKFYAVQRV